MSLAGCQIKPIDINFHLQKSLEIFYKKSARQNLIQKGQGDKSISPHANYGKNQGLLLKDKISAEIFEVLFPLQTCLFYLGT